MYYCTPLTVSRRYWLFCSGHGNFCVVTLALDSQPILPRLIRGFSSVTASLTSTSSVSSFVLFCCKSFAHFSSLPCLRTWGFVAMESLFVFSSKNDRVQPCGRMVVSSSSFFRQGFSYFPLFICVLSIFWLGLSPSNCVRESCVTSPVFFFVSQDLVLLGLGPTYCRCVGQCYSAVKA